MKKIHYFYNSKYKLMSVLIKKIKGIVQNFIQYTTGTMYKTSSMMNCMCMDMCMSIRRCCIGIE